MEPFCVGALVTISLLIGVFAENKLGNKNGIGCAIFALLLLIVVFALWGWQIIGIAKFFEVL